MTISKERLGEIALAVLQVKLEAANDINLNPKGIRREVNNMAKNLNFPSSDMAEFAKHIITRAYERTIAEIDPFIRVDDDGIKPGTFHDGQGHQV